MHSCNSENNFYFVYLATVFASALFNQVYLQPAIIFRLACKKMDTVKPCTLYYQTII